MYDSQFTMFFKHEEPSSMDKKYNQERMMKDRLSEMMHDKLSKHAMKGPYVIFIGYDKSTGKEVYRLPYEKRGDTILMKTEGGKDILVKSNRFRYTTPLYDLSEPMESMKTIEKTRWNEKFFSEMVDSIFEAMLKIEGYKYSVNRCDIPTRKEEHHWFCIEEVWADIKETECYDDMFGNRLKVEFTVCFHVNPSFLKYTAHH